MGKSRQGSTHRRKFLLGAAMLAAYRILPAAAQSFPTRSVRFIVPSAAGSGTDILTRIICSKLSDKWGQTIVVDDHDGVGGVLGVDIAARADPDGYTLCMGFTGPLAASPALLTKVPYDPLKDLAPVTLIDSSPAVLVINPALPVESIKELIAFSKKRSEPLTFGSAGYGTIGHISGELFKLHSGANIVHVPYKNVSQAVTDVVAGHLSMIFHVAPAVMPLVKASKLRALGVTSLKPWSILPQLPAIAEQGLPGYEATVWHGVVVRAGTPPQLINKLYKDITDVMKTDEVRQKFALQWAEPLGTTPDEFGKFLKSEVESYAALGKTAGFKIK